MNKLIIGLTRMGRKLTTKPAWWLETHRSYPIRDQWKCLSPIQTAQGPTVFAVLTTPSTFNDALWTAWSWMRFLGDAVRLEIFVDGPVTDEMRRWKEELLPGSGLSNAIDLIRSEGPYPPHVESYITGHNTGRKLGLLLALQLRGKFLYSDGDVLVYSRPTEILDLLDANETGAYSCDVRGGNFAKATLARAASLGLSPAEDLNSGILLVPRNALSWEMANEILWQWQIPPIEWTIEQTAVACLLASSPMTPLPRDRYVLRNDRQFYWQQDVDYSTIVARHFTGPTKHVLYGKGMPWLLHHQAVT